MGSSEKKLVLLKLTSSCDDTEQDIVRTILEKFRRGFAQLARPLILNA